MTDNISLGDDCQQNLDSDCQQTGTIYKITNLINGKIYVGQTKRTLEKRIAEHISASKTATSGIDAAIRKYGWENFKVEVLEICPVDKLDEREVFYIKELNSKAPNGYNLTDGGNSNSNPSKETRARMSANHADVSGKNNPNYGKHRKHSQTTRAKMSAAQKGKNHPLYGKHHTETTKAKISAAKKGRKTGSRTPEVKAKISAGSKGKHPHQGIQNPHYGKHHTEATKAKLSAAQKAVWARKKALANGDD